MDKNDLILEKIEAYNLLVFQDPRYFKFGIDAFCLAEFTKKYVKKKGAYIDLCSGTGIVAILLSSLLHLDSPKLVEINPYFCQISRDNLSINEIKGQVLELDIKDLKEHLPRESVDFITINPPYMKANHGLKTKNSNIDLAKIESSHDFLGQVFKNAHYLLRDRGQLFMVHRVERLVDIFFEARQAKMEPKTIQYIRNKGSSKASLVLIRFVKNGNKFLENLDDYLI